MLFHVHQSVIEVALSSKEPQITFSLFRYNKGKERFKKRYELAYSTESDGCVWDLRNRGKVEREGDSRGCSARLFDVLSVPLSHCVEALSLLYCSRENRINST